MEPGGTQTHISCKLGEHLNHVEQLANWHHLHTVDIFIEGIPLYDVMGSIKYYLLSIHVISLSETEKNWNQGGLKPMSLASQESALTI